jgi:twitching motility protein PilT
MVEDYRSLINDLLYVTAQQRASDLHLSPGYYPTIRVNGKLLALSDKGVLAPATITGLLTFAMQENGVNKDEYIKNGEINFTFSLEGKARYRASAYKTRGFDSIVFRFIPEHVGSLEDLNLPNQITFFSRISQGLVLVVSPDGHGKTTTAASLVNLINKERYEKIMTIEHPIEYVFYPEKSVIDQREIILDAPSFEKALENVSRKNINVLMVDNIDSQEKMNGALSVAEGGVLVVATISSPASGQALEKMISLSDPRKESETRLRLSNTVSGVVAQKLIPRIQGGMIPAVEIVVATPGVRELIREKKLGQLNLVIDTSTEYGMNSLNRALAELVKRNEISVEQAEFHSLDRAELKSFIR